MGQVLTVDGTQYSTVIVCQLCGARQQSTTRHGAYRAAAHHLEAAHPGADRAEATAGIRRAMGGR